MFRKALLTVFAVLMVTSLAAGQTSPWRFRWQADQVLLYKVEQVITAVETAGDAKVETKTKLNLTKRWQVLQVDNAGTATLQLSLAQMRHEITTPGGEALVFDSANPDKSEPQLREQLGRFVGQPLAILRVDVWGRVVEVKESKFGPASRYENELPFLVSLPAAAPQPGQGWERAYRLTLEPPHGTGEKFDAVQTCTCKATDDRTATLTLATTLKTMPEALADRIPLLQLQPEGQVTFDIQAGLLRSARLQINKEITGHQGEGSSHRFQSVYTEEYQAP